MEKRRLFKIMGKSPRQPVITLAREIERHYAVMTIKPPVKTLVMLKMREPVARTEYFLGELLACEAMVQIGEQQGMAVTAGDDFEKVVAMAIIDAAYNAGLPEVAWLDQNLEALEVQVTRTEQQEYSGHLQSKVQFQIMEGE